MNLAGKRILLTGATGGLGNTLAKQLTTKGANLAILGRDSLKLKNLKNDIQDSGNKVISIEADLSQKGITEKAINETIEKLGGIDVVINNAGVLDFIAFENQSEERIQEIIHTNVTAVIQLSHAAMPYFKKNNAGHLVFIGSIFGSLGFPYYATYCASKFAIHGFSQALRRELVSTNIGITYVAPRFIKTAMNNEAATAMTKKSGNKMDSPEKVAALVLQGLEQEKQEVFIGQPETFFSWLNGVAPKLVNLGLKKQTLLAQSFLDHNQ
ncbi:MAG TPA: SDR family oxidoreductase [Methylophilaceae bacterium]|nr:SDR family oxidoreductase [Methylophilaceae bacterium]